MPAISAVRGIAIIYRHNSPVSLPNAAATIAKQTAPKPPHLQNLPARLLQTCHPQLRAHFLQGMPVQADASSLQKPTHVGYHPTRNITAGTGETQAEGERLLPVPEHHLAGYPSDEGEHRHPEHRIKAVPGRQGAPQICRPNQGDTVPQLERVQLDTVQ